MRAFSCSTECTSFTHPARPPPSYFPSAVTSSLPTPTLIPNKPWHLQEHCHPHTEKTADCCLLAWHSTRQRPEDTSVLDHRVAAAREVDDLFPTEVRALSRGPRGGPGLGGQSCSPEMDLGLQGPSKGVACLCVGFGGGAGVSIWGKECDQRQAGASIAVSSSVLGRLAAVFKTPVLSPHFVLLLVLSPGV